MTQEEVINHFANRADEYIELSRGPAEGPLRVAHLAKFNPERMVDAGWWLKATYPQLKTVLEIGCGAGRLAKWFHDALGFSYTGIDPSRIAIHQALSWYKNDPSFNFHCSTIQKFMESGKGDHQRFNLVFTFGVLQHLPPDDLRFVADLMRLASDFRMIVEMVKSDAEPPAPHVWVHDYKELFGIPVYEEWLDDYKKIFIFINRDNVI